MDSPAPPIDVATTAVVIPVKSFELAKERLAEALTGPERAALARSMAARVVAAARPLPAFVVCGSAEVAAWAEAAGAGVLWHPRPGLNRAVAFACRTLAGGGYRQAIVAHGDLPRATSLAWVADFEGVTIVPDRRGDGTNVLGLPLGTRFEFRYGPGSADRHRTEAERRGLTVRVVPDEALGWDVDTPEDLVGLDPSPAEITVEAEGRSSTR